MSAPASKLYVSANFLADVGYFLTMWQSYAPLTAAERATAASAYQDVQGDARTAALAIHAKRQAALLAGFDKRAGQ